MKQVEPHFCNIVTTLEDMHGVAIEGTMPDLSPDMVGAIILHLRSYILQLEQLLTAAVPIAVVGKEAR